MQMGKRNKILNYVSFAKEEVLIDLPLHLLCSKQQRNEAVQDLKFELSLPPPLCMCL